MDIQRILDILLKFGKEILYEKDIEKVISSITDLARKLVNAERCSIFLYDKEKNVLYTKFAHGINQPIEIPANKGIVGFTATTGEIQIVIDAYNDSRFYAAVDKVTGFKTRNLLTVPLLDSKNNVFGVVEAINKKEGFFTNFDAELLVIAASYISYILDNAFLHKKIKDTSAKLIYKLSSAAEFKDEETSLHTKRVAYYSEIVAKALKLSHEFIDFIKITAPMHDVGKIGIPDKILHKQGELTKEEFEIIKTHPTIGFNILDDKESEILKIAANIARDHHEKWNGKGYPNKFKGEEISLEGRIVAIADVFDALTTKRPYKPAWPIEKAIDLIKKERGEHFDPNVTDAFLNNFDEIIKIYNKYKED